MPTQHNDRVRLLKNALGKIMAAQPSKLHSLPRQIGQQVVGAQQSLLLISAATELEFRSLRRVLQATADATKVTWDEPSVVAANRFLKIVAGYLAKGDKWINDESLPASSRAASSLAPALSVMVKVLYDCGADIERFEQIMATPIALPPARAGREPIRAADSTDVFALGDCLALCSHSPDLYKAARDQALILSGQGECRDGLADAFGDVGQ